MFFSSSNNVSVHAFYAAVLYYLACAAQVHVTSLSRFFLSISKHVRSLTRTRDDEMSRNKCEVKSLYKNIAEKVF